MVMKKRYSYTNQKDLDGLRWTSRVVDFGVSLTNTAALNELTIAFVMLRDRKDIYRHSVRRFANEAILAADRKRQAMFSVMANREFFDTYSDAVIDLAERDIVMFRIGIKQTLDDHGVEDSELFSYMETARTILDMAKTHFEISMETARNDFGFDYSKTFAEFNVRDVFDLWGRACESAYRNESNVDLNTERNVMMFNQMAKKFADGDYVDACLKGAVAEFPDFANEINEKDEKSK